MFVGSEMQGAGFLHEIGEHEGLAGSDVCRIQTGVRCYQVLLLFSKNDHITPKWQICACGVGFTPVSSS